MDANKLKHLELIRGVVNRLATESARMKGWCVTLVTALFFLLARGGGREYICVAFVAFVPILAFWVLDGYYLWQERLFRALYDRVRSLEESDIDFSMEVDQFLRVGRTRRACLNAMFSGTLTIFYGLVSLMVVGVVIALLTFEGITV